MSSQPPILRGAPFVNLMDLVRSTPRQSFASEQAKQMMGAGNPLSGKDIRKPESYLEKPVKADAYVNTINQALQSPSVKTLVSHSVSASDPEEVKDELKNLIDGADPEKLAEALKILKKKK